MRILASRCAATSASVSCQRAPRLATTGRSPFALRVNLRTRHPPRRTRSGLKSAGAELRMLELTQAAMVQPFRTTLPWIHWRSRRRRLQMACRFWTLNPKTKSKQDIGGWWVGVRDVCVMFVYALAGCSVVYCFDVDTATGHTQHTHIHVYV